VPSGLNSVIGISCSMHSVALTSEGKLVAWGYNEHGQCNVPEDLSVLQFNILM
jgi:alpha-tubulin suppressor-like RCC1 family protein